jgi:hypothetical protein
LALGGFDIESYQHGLYARLLELLDHRLFWLGRPGAIPVFGKSFDISELPR